MDARMERRQNDRSTRILKGPPMTFASAGEIFSASEWAQVISDLSLSLRQAQIVRLLFANRSDGQIAAELDISIPTVRTHLSRLFARFAVQDRTELILYVFRRFRGGCQPIRGHR